MPFLWIKIHVHVVGVIQLKSKEQFRKAGPTPGKDIRMCSFTFIKIQISTAEKGPGTSLCCGVVVTLDIMNISSQILEICNTQWSYLRLT